MAYPPDPVDIVIPPPKERAFACLREGTEVLRTGGGTTLTADQCNAVFDELERARDVCAEIERLLVGPAWPKTAPLVDIIAAHNLAAAEKTTLEALL